MFYSVTARSWQHVDVVGDTVDDILLEIRLFQFMRQVLAGQFASLAGDEGFFGSHQRVEAFSWKKQWENSAAGSRPGN